MQFASGSFPGNKWLFSPYIKCYLNVYPLMKMCSALKFPIMLSLILSGFIQAAVVPAADGTGSISGSGAVSVGSIPAPRRVTVLPIVSSDVSKGLLGVLADDFRQSLKKTGVYSVMDRELMNKILEEQEFQQSDVCVDVTCMVNVGKIIGVQQIIAVSISKVKKGRFAVSARVIEVQTSQVVKSASEERRGDIYEINKRMLHNIATALAGSPNEDHLEYLSLQKDNLKDKKTMERALAKKYEVSASLFLDYPFDVLRKDNLAPVKEFFYAHPEYTQWGLPERVLEFGGYLTYSYHLNDKLWLRGVLGFTRTSLMERYVLGAYPHQRTEVQAMDTINFHGNEVYNSKSFQYVRLVDIGAGLKFDVLQLRNVSFNLQLTPYIGLLTVHKTKWDSTYINAHRFVNGTYTGRQIRTEEAVSVVEMDGIAFGGGAALGFDYYPLVKWSVSVSMGFKLMIAPVLEGQTEEVLQTYTVNSDNPINPEKAGSDNQTRAAWVKGDFLGTGEYADIRNPDANSVLERTYFEYTNFKINIAVGYHF